MFRHPVRIASRSRFCKGFETLEPRRFFAAYVAGDATVYQTIQAAVDAALPGGTVNVDPGVYAEQVTVYKSLTIRGARAGSDARSNSRGVNETIVTGKLDGNGLITGAFKIGANNITVDGFTIQGQTTWTDSDGAGIVILPNRNGTHILNNIIQNNVAGMYLANNSTTNPAVIRYNLFQYNNNDGNHSGRGIYTNGGLTGGNLVNVTIDNNAFLYNLGSAKTTTTLEAGISLQTLAPNAQSDIRITNNIFDQGGKAVLFFNVSNCLIQGNTITYMRDQWSGALRFEGGNSNITIRDNTLYGITGPAIRIDNKGVPGPNQGFVINGNNFYGNGYNTAKEALVVNGGQYTGYLDARNNWWNSPSGPSGAGAGTGEQIIANGNNIDFSNWATAIFPRANVPFLGTPQLTDSLIQLEDFDHGGQGIGYNDTDTANLGGHKYRNPQRVDIQPTTDVGGGLNIGFVRTGEWLQYTINVLQGGVFNLNTRVAANVSGHKFNVEIDGVNVTGSISLPNTGGSQNWTTVIRPGINLTPGLHVVRFVFETNGGNYNWFSLTNAAPQATPAAPTGLAASAPTYTAVNLVWQDKSNNETGFIIERKTGAAGVWEIIQTTAAGATSYTDSAVSPDTSYVYRVRAKNDAGESSNSNEAAVSTPAVQTVFYLSDLAWVGTPINGWGPVEKNMSVGGSGANDGTPLKLNGVTYAKGLGAHAYSEIVYNLNGQYATFLSDVGLDDKQTTNGSVVFQVFADGVKIYDSGVMRPTTATQSINVSVAGVQQLKLVVTDAGDGVSYDHADWAGARLILASQAPTAPAAPSGLTASAINASKVDLSWTDVAGETSYRIERSTDGVNFTAIGTAGANATTYSDTTASASTTYHYRVVALNSAGESPASNTASATTPAAPTVPAAPTGLAASAASSSQINLTWTDNANNETGYIVERSTNGINFTQIATLAADAIAYPDGAGLSAGTQYLYRVRATNSAGASGNSNVADATTQPAVGLPTGWASGDIGAVGAAGSTSVDNGTWTVKGAGTDIWGNADSFHYAYREVTGDATIVVRITSVQNTDLLAKAGLMFRDSLAPNAKQVGLFMTPGGGLRLMRRTSTGGSTTATSVTGPKAPYWLKLVRTGGTITAYSSADGATWTTVGAVSVSMNSTIYVGLAVTSKKTSTTATATFDNLSVI